MPGGTHTIGVAVVKNLSTITPSDPASTEQELCDQLESKHKAHPCPCIMQRQALQSPPRCIACFTHADFSSSMRAVHHPSFPLEEKGHTCCRPCCALLRVMRRRAAPPPAGCKRESPSEQALAGEPHRMHYNMTFCPGSTSDWRQCMCV